MSKRRKWVSVLGASLLTIQLVSPIGTALAAENGNLLPPSNTTYNASSPDDGKLVWNAVYGATGYNVYEIRGGQLVLVGSTNTNSYTLSNQAEGSKLYVVTTISADGESGPSAPFNVTIDYPTMVAPTSLSNTIQNGNDIVLSWAASAYAENYRVYQLAEDGTAKLLTTTPSRTYTIVNSQEGNFSYYVTAVNSLYGESDKTAPMQVSVVYPKLSEPKNVAFKISNGNDLTLTWQSASYANQYKVYQVINGEEVLQKSVSTTSATFTNMPVGDYVYKIYAVSDRFGTSAASPITATVSPVVMAKPSSFTSTIKNINDATLSWTSVDNADSYKLYQIVGGEKVLKGTYTTLTTTLSKLPGGDYTFEVHSYSDRFGESSDGATVSFNVATVTMVPPTSFTSQIQNLNDIVLNWNVADNAENYKVYQIIDGQRVLKGTITGTTTTFTNQPSGEYVYEITSNSSRFGESSTAQSLKVTLDPVIINSPTNFKNTVENGNDIVLAWDAADNATNYRVYQMVNGSKVLKATVTGTTKTFTNLPDGEYKYVINTYNTRFGESSVGTELTINLTHPDMLAPSNATYENPTPTSVKLSWDPVQYATSYKVYLVSQGVKTLKGTYTGTNVTYSNMSPGEYTYEIHAVSDRFGESQLGRTVNAVVVGQQLDTPANFKYDISNGNDVSLSWDVVQYATSYKIYKVSNGSRVLFQTTTTNNVKYTNLPEGDYHFEVTASSTLLGDSPVPAVVDFTLAFPKMGNPANFTTTVQNTINVKLIWDAVPYANSYKVYELKNGQEVLVGTYTTTSATLSNLPEGIHNYKVRSYSIRFGESVEGSSASAEIVYPNILAPANLTTSILNGNDIKLTWTAVQNASSYKVYKVDGDTRTLLRTVTGTTTTFTNQPEGDYHYEVTTYSSTYGESLSSLADVTVDFPTMEAPSNLTSTVSAVNDITLNWGSVQYATGYNIYEVINGVEVFKKTVTGTTNKFTIVSEGTHAYVVRSVSDRFGESPVGNRVESTITYPVVQAPGNLSYTITSGNNINLSWSAVTNASGYKIYQIVGGQRVYKQTVTDVTATFTNMPEGDYTFEVTTDTTRFGESKGASSTSFTLVFPEMQPPASLAKTITNGNDINLSWQTSTYANYYKIYQVVNGVRTLLGTTTSTSISYTNQPQGNYRYEVNAYSTRFGESKEASVLTFDLVYPTMQPPTYPSQTITNGNDITLNWKASTYANSYKIYRVIDGQKQLVSTVTSLTNTFTNMPEGKYDYVIHSYSNRFGESPTGSAISFDLVWPKVTPSVLNGSIFNANNVTLTWSKTDYTDEYHVYEIKGNSKELVYKGKNLTTSVYNLTEENHSYQVASYSTRFGEHALSNISVFGIVYPEMGMPTPTVKVLDTKSATISWNFITYANGYNIYEVENGKATLVAEKVNNLSYTLQDLTHKNHYYYVTSYSNSFGESEPSDTVMVKLITDTVAPVTTTDYSEGWKNTNQTIKLSATDDESGVDKTFYSLNEGSFVEGTNITAATEGTHDLSYYSIDKAGNKEVVKTIEVQIDKTAPVTMATNIPADWVNGDVPVSLDSQDNLSGVAKTYYSINGGEYVEGSTFTVKQEGVNHISYYSVDNAGNKEEAKTFDIKIDKTTPVTSVAEIPTDWVKENVSVNLVSDDELSKVAKTYYSINGGEYVEGSSFVMEEGVNEVSFFSLDHAGNVEVPKSIEVKIDKTAPVTAVSDIPTGWVNENVSVDLTAEDNQSGVAKTYYSINGSDYIEGTNFTLDNEGLNVIKYYSVDNAGNKEISKAFEVKIDKTAPATAVNDVPKGWVKDDVTFTLDATDNLSGVAKTFYSINGSDFKEGTTFTVSKEGINKVSYYSVDNAGNKEEVTTTEVKIDKTVPVTESNITGGWNTENVSVSLTASDDLSGVAKTFYSVNGSEYVEGYTFVVADEGINKVSYYSLDAAGNKEAVKTQEVKIDKTTPETVSDIATQWSGKDVTVSLSTSDKSSGVSKTFYSVDGSPFVEGTSFVVSAEGISQVSFYSEDVAGNKESVKTQVVKIDKSAPVTTVTNVPSGWVNTNVSLTLNSKDDLSGVAKTYYSINGGVYVEGNSLVIDKEGVNKVSYYSVDQTGNKEEVKTVEVKIDKTIPEVALNLKGEYALGSQLNINYTSKDLLSGVASEQFVLKAPGEAFGKVVNPSVNVITLDKPGVYTLTAFVTDRAGNTQVVEKQFAVYINAFIEVTPGVIKGNNGVFTVRVDLPSGFDSKGLNLETAQLNGVKALNSNNGYYNQAKIGQFKFERSDFNWTIGEQRLEFRCYLNGYLVVGYTTVTVK